jgi:hypothetical protein
MARRQSRQIVLVLEPSDYDLLEAEAKRQDRDPWAQARWMLLRLLRSGMSADDGSRELTPLDAR